MSRPASLNVSPAPSGNGAADKSKQLEGKALVDSGAKRRARNPGPSWGYWFLRTADRLVPEWFYRPWRAFGTAVAMLGMPEQRRCSRAYLSLVFGRPARVYEVFRHFFAFEEALMLKLRITNGLCIPCHYHQEPNAFKVWMEQGGPVLLGTMHVGVSDMLGFQIGSMHQRKVYMVRQRVGNSHDTEEMEAKYGEHVKFIWVNEPGEMLFALKEAAGTEHAIAMQCDRLEHSARVEEFEFLGAKRRFPFTIYHLSFLFGRSVILSVGVSSEAGHSVLHASPRFDPVQGEPRALALERARKHFQDFLCLVESLLRKDPYVWFNFLPLNPPAEEAVSASKVSRGSAG